jgi:dTDP-4-amino-4,6-dideoxygalactose transaminase
LGKELCADFQNKGYTDFQAKVGLHLLKKFEAIKDTKKKNGALLYAGLNGLRGISLPRILEGSKPVFNRFPVLFESLDKKRLVSRRLNSQGIEALPLYDKPLHKVYPELNRSSKQDEFPRATYFAEHHLCLPTHTRVRPEDIARILRIFRESL